MVACVLALLSAACSIDTFGGNREVFFRDMKHMDIFTFFISTWSRTCVTSPATGAVTFADLERLYAPCGAEIEEFPLDGRRCFRGVRMPAE